MSAARTSRSAAQLLVRIKLPGGGVFGPGKAELLERIDSVGSISAAARQMGMSYRQAWKLIDTMNAVFKEPVIETSQGGPGGGGATLSSVGREVLRCYSALQGKAARCTSGDLKTISSLLVAKPTSRPPKARVNRV